MKRMKELFLHFWEKAREENDRNILSMLSQDKSAKVLDLGCNDGKLTNLVAERIGTYEVYGIDINKKH